MNDGPMSLENLVGPAETGPDWKKRGLKLPGEQKGVFGDVGNRPEMVAKAQAGSGSQEFPAPQYYEVDKFVNTTYEEARRDYDNLRLQARTKTLSPDEREKVRGLYDSIRLRWREVGELGVFKDGPATKKRLRDELIGSEWKNGVYKARITELAVNEENSACGKGIYGQNERLRGIVHDAVMGVVPLAELDGWGNATVAQKTAYGVDVDFLTELKRRIIEEVLWDPKLEYKALIDQETPQQKIERETRELIEGQ